MKALVLELGLLAFYFAAVSALGILGGDWHWVLEVGDRV